MLLFSAVGLTIWNEFVCASCHSLASLRTQIIARAPNAGTLNFSKSLASLNASLTGIVTITNTGTANLVFAGNNEVSIARGGNAADFRITSSDCPGVTLQPNQGNCTINVTFQPVTGTATTRTASLGVTHNAGTSIVPMSGTVGTGPVTTPPVGSGGSTTPPASGGSTAPTSGSSPAAATSSANAPLNGGAGSFPLAALMLLGAATFRRRA